MEPPSVSLLFPVPQQPNRLSVRSHLFVDKETSPDLGGGHHIPPSDRPVCESSKLFLTGREKTSGSVQSVCGLSWHQHNTVTHFYPDATI